MLKRLCWFVEDLNWSMKCSYFFWLHGPYGLARIVERMPLRFIIKFLRKYGATIGDNCIIDSGIKIHRPHKNNPFGNLIIGNNVYLGHNLLIDLTEKVIFEDDTALSACCQVWTHTGYYDQKLRDKNDYFEKTGIVIIKRSAICYSNVIVNLGITIGERSRVYAMSMVNKSVPDNEIWAGIPAVFIKNRELD